MTQWGLGIWGLGIGQNEKNSKIKLVKRASCFPANSMRVIKIPSYKKSSDGNIPLSKYIVQSLLASVSKNKPELSANPQSMEIPQIIDSASRVNTEARINEESKRDESIVHNLDYWDLHNVSRGGDALVKEIKKTISNYYQATTGKKIEIQNLNWKNELRDKIGIVNVKFVHPKIREIFKRSDEENGNMLAQNINMMKKKFKFDVFQNNHQEGSSHATDANEASEDMFIENELCQIGSQLAVRRKITDQDKSEDLYYDNEEFVRNIKVDDPILKFNNLKLEGNYEMLTSTEYYREIILEKDKLERVYRNEIFKISRMIDEKISKKEKLNQTVKELHAKLTESKDQYLLDTEAYELIKREADRLHQNEQKQEKHRMYLIEKHKAMQSQKEYEQNKVIFSEQINEHKKTISTLNAEINDLKTILQKIISEKITYYFNLLKKGIDVRNEGLGWIVFRLLELGATVEPNHFPRFLDFFQVKFLLSISQKKIELAKLKIIISSLKRKYQNKNKEREMISNAIMKKQKIKDVSYPKILNGSFALKQFQSGINTNKKIIKIINKIFNQNKDSWLKISYDDRIEDEMINQLVEKIKKDILANTSNSNDNYVKKTSRQSNCQTELSKLGASNLTSYGVASNGFLTGRNKNIANNSEDSFSSFPFAFTQDLTLTQSSFSVPVEKDVLNVIISLKEQIESLEEEIQQMKNFEIKRFKKKYDPIKQKGPSECVKYDLMFSALFGNYVVV